MFKLLFLLLFISNNCFAQEVKFHKAETKAEKTLDKILRMNAELPPYAKSSYSDMVWFIEGLDRYKKSNTKFTKEQTTLFNSLFTKKLIEDAKKQLEEHIKKNNCITKWTNEDCTMFSDANYISCAQDNPENYLYYTLKTENNKIYIHTAWDIFSKDNEDYYNKKAENFPIPHRIMKYEDGNWKLDGICCYGGNIMINCLNTYVIKS